MHEELIPLSSGFVDKFEAYPEYVSSVYSIHFSCLHLDDFMTMKVYNTHILKKRRSFACSTCICCDVFRHLQGVAPFALLTVSFTE